MKTVEQIELQVTGLEKHFDLVNEILTRNGWQNYCEELDYHDKERLEKALNAKHQISFNNEIYFKD